MDVGDSEIPIIFIGGPKDGQQMFVQPTQLRLYVDEMQDEIEIPELKSRAAKQPHWSSALKHARHRYDKTEVTLCGCAVFWYTGTEVH